MILDTRSQFSSTCSGVIARTSFSGSGLDAVGSEVRDELDAEIGATVPVQCVDDFSIRAWHRVLLVELRAGRRDAPCVDQGLEQGLGGHDNQRRSPSGAVRAPVGFLGAGGRPRSRSASRAASTPTGRR